MERVLGVGGGWRQSARAKALILERKIRQGFVHFNLTVVIEKSFFLKLAHEAAHLGARRADHLSEGLMGHPRNDG